MKVVGDPIPDTVLAAACRRIIVFIAREIAQRVEDSVDNLDLDIDSDLIQAQAEEVLYEWLTGGLNGAPPWTSAGR